MTVPTATQYEYDIPKKRLATTDGDTNEDRMESRQ